MCNLKRSGVRSQISSLPPHTPPVVSFIENCAGESFQKTVPRKFTYVAPVVKYAPAHFQPGYVYFGGEAAAIGNQPYNYSQGSWTAFSTPKQMDFSYKPGFKGSQSAASYYLAQQTMSQLLALRSANSGGR